MQLRSVLPIGPTRRGLVPALAVLLATAPVASQTAAPTQPAYGAELEGFAYPYPVERFRFPSQRQEVSMAFMDVAPTGAANGRTAVLLHGKNFCAATWETTIAALAGAGFRVIVPDQVGFCASTKPERYQFSFGQLAANTRALLASRGVERATILGHSMGGMLAVRYALMFPQATERLVLLNPLGLEDWQAEGVPYSSPDQNMQGELRTDYDSIRAYQLRFYYDNQWKPEYERWARMSAGLYAGPGRDAVAWNQALTSEMIQTQPVVHEFGRITVPTLLMIGGRDRTAPGAARAPREVQEQLGRYAELGRRAADAIPGARLVEFPELAHSPQVEAPTRFHAVLLRALD